MNDEHPDTIDTIAMALQNPEFGAAMRVPDFTDELTRRGGLVVYCDNCDVEQWCADEQSAHDAVLAHRMATRYDADDFEEFDDDDDFEPGEFNEDCDVALYVISIVGGVIVPLHHSQFDVAP